MTWPAFFALAFWLLALAPLTAFVLYPLAVVVASKVVSRLSAPKAQGGWPALTLIISAYNEEKAIRARLDNVYSLRYPRRRLEVLVPTDGSTDRTDSIVFEYADRGARLLRSARNRGKSAALNDAMRAARGEVVVFTDANSLFGPDALLRLARWFGRPDVGCVCGRLVYSDAAARRVGEAAAGESAYWDWDTRLKHLEGRGGHLLGANGAIFAVRRSLLAPLPGNQSNDMTLPIVARLRGAKCVFEPRAVAREATAGSLRGEFRRKSRIIARGLCGVGFSFRWAARLMTAGRASFGAVAVTLAQVVAKKACRYLAFPAISLMMIVGLFAGDGATRLCAAALWAGAVVAVLVTLARPLARTVFPRWPSFAYPLAVFGAGCLALVQFLSRRDLSRWRSER